MPVTSESIVKNRPSVRRTERRLLVVVLIVAWGLRAGCVVWLQQRLDAHGQEFLIDGDAAGYWELANDLVNGQEYAVHEPPRRVHRMPGFPLLLAVPISVFGPSKFAARQFLAVIAASCCLLVYLLGRRLVCPRVGLFAAALLAISPSAIGFSGLILSETAFTWAMLLGLLALSVLVEQLERQTCRRVLFWAAVTGISFAMGVYMKPSWILIGPLTALLLLFSRQQFRWRLLAGGVVILAMCLSLLPWGLRNWHVSGHFTLTTFWMGPSLYDGLNPHATGDSDMRFFDEDRFPLRMSEYEVDREYRSRALKFARNNPRRVLELAGIKFWRYWKPWPNAAQFDRPVLRIVLTVYTVPIYVFACWGAWQLRERIWSLAISAGPVIYFCALHLLFVSSLRYRLPGEAPLMILAAIGALSFLQRVRSNRSEAPR